MGETISYLVVEEIVYGANAVDKNAIPPQQAKTGLAGDPDLPRLPKIAGNWIADAAMFGNSGALGN
jgi:hypothetical protein